MNFALSKRIFVLLVFLFFIKTIQVEASHSMGSDLTYRCLGGNRYEITLSFYRDCAGIPADTQAWVDISSSCSTTGNMILNLIPGTGREITPLCPSQVSTCNGGTFTGIQEYIYRGIITLPGQCTDWTFSYNLCCRNNAITNIDFPGSTQIFVFATLNNTITPCNNSPTFSNLPVPFVCLGEQYCYNHGAFDADGDSLVYQLITPMDSPGFTVAYNGSFSATNPLSSNPPMTFNPATGDICMKPSNLEVTVMAVLVKEYRNGVLIGSVERDIQVTVIDCNNQLPSVSGINGTNNFSASVCAGSQLCFNLSSSDANAGQNTTLNWDQSIPGATFTVVPGPRQSASFCWTPQQSDISSNPYCFTVLVQDDNCPFLGSQVFSYCITVNGLNVNAGPNVSVGCNSTTSVTATASGGNGNYTYSWNTGVNGPSLSGGPGTYIVTASSGGCTAKDTVQILAGTNTPTAAFSMAYTCSGLGVQFTNQSTIAGGTMSGYTWVFGDGNTSTATSPSHTYPGTGTYQVMLIAQAVGGCVDTVVQSLNLVNDPPHSNFSQLNACVGTPVNFTDQSTSISAINSWNWNFGDAGTSNVPSPAHTYAGTGTYQVKLVITNANGCSDSITKSVTVYPLPTPFAGNDASVCEGNSVNLSGTGGGTYLWNPGNLTTANIQITPAQTITYTLEVTSANGCVAQDDVTITVNPTPVLTPMQDQSICIGAAVTLSANGNGGPGGGLNYAWTPSGGNTRQITVSPLSTTSYTVRATNASGCYADDTVSVTVNPLPVLNTNSTDAQCFGSSDGIAAVQVSTGSSPFTYSWNPGGTNSAQATGLSAGNYTVTVTDANGCSQTSPVTISEPSALNLTPGSTDALCAGSSDGTASVLANGGTPGYTYQWASGNTSSTMSGIPAGNYTVIVSDNHSCTASITAIVSEPGPLSLTPSVTNVQCFGMNNGSASVLAGGGTSGYSYAWTGVSGSGSSLAGLSPGNYSVTVTDAHNCTSNVSMQITEPSVLQVSISSSPTTCTGSAHGTAAVIAGGGTAAYTYAWSPSGGSLANATGLSSGNYSCLVTDNNGCTSVQNINVGVIGEPVISPGSVSEVSCFGGSNGSASVTVSAGTAPYFYQWAPAGGTNATANNLATGTYTVTVTDNNGCTSSQQMIISGPPAISTTVSVTDVSCFNGSDGSASINVSGGSPGYNYSWNPAAGNSPGISGKTAGTYTVSVIDAHGCIKNTQIIIAQPTAIQLTPASVPASCHGSATGSVSVNAVGGTSGYTYAWTPGAGTSSTYTGVGAGNYTVIVTDAHSCTATSSIQVSEPPALNLVMASVPAACSAVGNGSASVQVSGGTAGYSYSWSPRGGSGANAPGLTPGLYSVSVTDAHGCTSTNSVTVASIGGPQISPASQTNVSCFGGNNGSASVNISAGTPPYTINWTPGGGNATSAVNLSAGNYTVNVTDVNGCLIAHQIIITQPPLLTASANTTDVSCFGMTNGSVNVIVNGGEQPYTYVWQPAVSAGSSANNAGAGNYSVIISDHQGCTQSVNATVQQPTQLIPVISSNDLQCYADHSGSAGVSVSGGVPAYIYLWSPGGSTNSNISGLNAGNYTVLITDDHGCTSQVSTLISQPQGVNVNLSGDSVLCIGQSSTLTAHANGGTLPYSYVWNTGSTDSSIVTSPIVSSNYSVQVTDGNGCPVSPLYFNIRVNPPLTVDASNQQIICEGDAVSISALANGGNGGPYTYSWNQGAIFGSNNTVHPVSDSMFVVTATDACGTPAAMDSVLILVYPLPQVDFLPQNISGCTPVTAQFTNFSSAPAGSSYYWNLGDHSNSTETEPLHVYSVPGVYDVSLTIVSPEGCTSTLMRPQAVKVYGYPLASFNQSATEISILNPGIVFSDASTDAVHWEWDFGDSSEVSFEQNPIHEYLDSGTYTVRLIVHSNGGCADTIYSTVRVEMEFIIHVPNAFSPNGDGINDGFKAYGIGYSDYSMWILDRWGKKIFHVTDKEKSWDGTYFDNGNQCQADVYEWVLDVLDYKRITHRLIGHVTLFR